MFDIYTIIFLALAVFIFLRLRSVLGQKTGRERPPYDPVAMRPGNDKVVTLPTRNLDAALRPAESEDPVTPANRWTDIAEAGTPLAAGLDAIAQGDPSFDGKSFVAGARQAYEMVVTAFAEGDRKQLKMLLSRDVYEGFESAIRQREQRGETAESRFVSIDKADIVGAEVRGGTAQVTLRFVSQIISATRDKSGAVIDGSDEKVIEVIDVWTFAREVGSRDPNWKLVATETGQ